MGNFNILPIRITDNNTTANIKSVVEGIKLAADQGARVINVSYALGEYGAVDEAARYARTKGALTFIGAGNSNSLRPIIDWPNLIFVAGTNRDDGRWVQNSTLGSSWGPYVDLAAPADDILVADPTLLPNGLGLIDGTSFSTPLAAGVAALAFSINPKLTPDEVEQLLKSTAIDDAANPGRDDFFGYGRLNAAGVVQGAVASVPEPGTIGLAAIGAAIVVFCRCRRRGRTV